LFDWGYVGKGYSIKYQDPGKGWLCYLSTFIFEKGCCLEKKLINGYKKEKGHDLSHALQV